MKFFFFFFKESELFKGKDPDSAYLIFSFLLKRLPQNNYSKNLLKWKLESVKPFKLEIRDKIYKFGDFIFWVIYIKKRWLYHSEERCSVKQIMPYGAKFYSLQQLNNYFLFIFCEFIIDRNYHTPLTDSKMLRTWRFG